jgi:hypothetical protein
MPLAGQHLLGHGQGGEAGIGDQQGLGDPGGLERLRELGNAAGAELHGGGVVPIGFGHCFRP